ncbi:ABC transporter substrate-binding protein [Micromonospora sp. NPDC005203]|uniref:ABC transporter substrate-binding protein n=1 Tax=Micromonospora sp. NPDC005203 TaxID=3364226 RepID=UPI0036A7D2E9
MSLGSNQSDPKPKDVLVKVTDGFKTASGVQVAVNTVDHNTFQENINNYLQGKPDDVFTWFAGYRMRFFAQKGLASDISDVWGKISGYSDAFKKASTGDDGKQYFVPASYYPWAVFYRKSVWQQHGYQVPTTLDQFTALGEQMSCVPVTSSPSPARSTTCAASSSPTTTWSRRAACSSRSPPW